MKNLIKTVLAMGMMCGFTANAHEESEELCYPLVHGENGMGSANFMYTPILFTVKPVWRSYIFVTNASEKNVNVRFSFMNSDGSKYVPYSVTHHGQFTEDNSPIEQGLGWAILRPNESAYVILYDDNKLDGFTGKVIWQANACIEKAITAYIRTYRYDNTSMDLGLVPLNGGNPF